MPRQAHSPLSQAEGCALQRAVEEAFHFQAFSFLTPRQTQGHVRILCQVLLNSTSTFLNLPPPHSCAGPLVWPVGRHGLGSPMLRGECRLHGWCSGSSSRSVCRGSVHSHSWPCLQKQWAREWRPGWVRTQASVDRG